MDVAAAFENLAEWAAGSSPLYERLCRGIAGDEALLALAGQAPEDRSVANLLLAAVHDELLSTDAAGTLDHDLAAFYPTCTADPVDPEERDPLPAFRSFALANADAIEATLTTRRTQTNAVGRCSALYPAFAHVARRTDGPLALVEIGPSAGLNLLWDRYRYTYHGERVEVGCGPRDAPVHVETRLRGGRVPPLPARPPAVTSRVGVDLHPMDVTDPADAQWLRALIWPEHHERRRLLDAAIDVAREDPPDLVAGNALERLPAVVENVPDDRPVCVYSTLFLYQLDEAGRQRLRDVVTDLGTDRPLYWVTGGSIANTADGGIGMTCATVEDGDLAVEDLLAFEQHGKWVEWGWTDADPE